MLKPVKNIVLITAITFLAGCQSQYINYSQSNKESNNNKLEFSTMLSKAELCIVNKEDTNQCYRKAFPQRCRNFSNEMHTRQSTIQQKMNNCVSACQQATIATRLLGACTTIF